MNDYLASTFDPTGRPELFASIIDNDTIAYREDVTRYQHEVCSSWKRLDEGLDGLTTFDKLTVNLVNVLELNILDGVEIEPDTITLLSLFRETYQTILHTVDSFAMFPIELLLDIGMSSIIAAT